VVLLAVEKLGVELVLLGQRNPGRQGHLLEVVHILLHMVAVQAVVVLDLHERVVLVEVLLE
jgi:hypothetical protein